MTKRWFYALLMALGFVLAGCQDEPECSEELACPFGSICVEGVCEVKYCATSAQCGMEQFCDNGRCAEGCDNDADCYPGDVCDAESATCSPEACDDTHADCGFKEFCNFGTGECYEAGGYYCQACSDDGQCGGNGNICYQGYCATTCSSDDDCPSGFTCIGFIDSSGEYQYFQCYAYCDLFDDLEDLDRAEQPRPWLEWELPECLQVEEEASP